MKRTMDKRRMILVVFIFLLFVWTIHDWKGMIALHSSTPYHVLYRGNYTRKDDSENRWIVVTTIFAPTDCIQFMASMADWSMVVIGDKKTPNPWSDKWKVPIHVHYLSVEDQLKLPYKIIALLPWNNYGRKNIGFLYAISKGATVIYEIDDDNCPEEPRMIYLSERLSNVDEAVTNYQTSNAYSFFAQPTVWQRGIPVQDIKREPLTLPRRRSSTTLFVPFQQALADHDPDVDAMFRLTRDLPIYFDKSMAPIALPIGTFSPTNSQNTVSHTSAFWATLLPISPSPRVTDIWRGYWNQRLLWDIGAQQLFLPPTVTQYRTAQSYLSNLKAETQLYEQSTALVRFLLAWSYCAETLPERMKKLAEDMTHARFWNQSDSQLMHAWVDDLTALGYQWPRLDPKSVNIWWTDQHTIGCMPVNLQSLWKGKDPMPILKELAFYRPSYFTFSYQDYRGF